MKFAFFTHVPWPEGTDQQQIIAQTTEQVQYAEELGFHGAWLAEHHFTRYSMVSSSLVLATYIAASGAWSIRRCCALWSCSPKR